MNCCNFKAKQCNYLCKMKKLISCFWVLVVLCAHGQDKPAYRIFNAKGKPTTYKAMLKASKNTNVVLFGELHNNSIAHWLQLALIKDLILERNLVLGAEMLEQDNQEALNNYLAGTINQKQLDTLARLWPNYKTDYAPLVNFAKENKLAFVATNIPRRFASLVHKKGFAILDSLSDVEKSWIAPLPIPFDSLLSTYQNIFNMLGAHASPNLVKAQAIKDATMAYFISKNIAPNKIFVHFNGAYHSDFYEGIGWYLKHYNASLKHVTISTVTQDQLKNLEKEHLRKADFIICVDQDVTTTY